MRLQSRSLKIAEPLPLLRRSPFFDKAPEFGVNHDLCAGSLREQVCQPAMVDVMVGDNNPFYVSGVDIVVCENSGQLRSISRVACVNEGVFGSAFGLIAEYVDVASAVKMETGQASIGTVQRFCDNTVRVSESVDVSLSSCVRQVYRSSV